MREIFNKEGRSVMYLNSGDWIENLTALEYHDGSWSIYEYALDYEAQHISPAELSKEEDVQKVAYKNKELYEELIEEFQLNALKDTDTEKNLTTLV
ncbi:MAG: hypothetical protein AAGD28_12245 [Bacteroidota bacterium]